VRLDGVSSSPPCNVGRYVRGYGRDSDHRVDNPLLFRCARKGKTTKNDREKRGFRQEQILFQIQNGKCIHWPTSALNEIETEECAIQPSSPDLSHYEYEDRRRSGGPALSSALNEIETGECAIQPLFPDLSRCEYGDRPRSGAPALSYSANQENPGLYSHSQPPQH